MPSLLGQLTRAVERCLALAVVALLAVLVGIAAAETAAWVLLDRSFAVAGELQSVLLVWLSLLAAAWGVAGGLHLGIDMVTRRLPPRARRWVAAVASAAVALFGILLAVHGGRLAGSVVNTLPATGWSAAVGYLPAVVGGALIAFFALAEVALGPRPSELADGDPR